MPALAIPYRNKNSDNEGTNVTGLLREPASINIDRRWSYYSREQVAELWGEELLLAATDSIFLNISLPNFQHSGRDG